MFFCGIDIGSRTGKIVVVDEQLKIIYSNIAETIKTAYLTAEKLINEIPFDIKANINKSAATGYGRNAISEFAEITLTEITAHYLGAKYFFPEVKTIIDIGGQDSKVIKASENSISDFLMNDRCAAGTGRFIEVMTERLGYTIEELALIDMKDVKPAVINATCTVFAESEVVSLMATDTKTIEIIAAIAKMAASNIYSMAAKLHAKPPFVMTGGVSKIKPVVYFLEQFLKSEIKTDKNSQIMGALGAAIAARESDERKYRY